ncbi:MAG TPA: cytochrome c biogenesis protein CcsA [Gemmatimonadales bacterium]
MTSIAHVLAVTLYLAAAAAAAVPLARPVRAPVGWVVRLLGAGFVVHATGLLTAARDSGQLPLTGLGPALSVAALLLALTLLAAELLAREVTLTLATAPLLAVATAAANVIGLHPAAGAEVAAGPWLMAHIAVSFVGIAAYGTAAAAGTMYLVEHRELKSRRFGALFRLFPPLDTLDRVNHIASVAGGIVLTLGLVLAVSYALAFHGPDLPKLVWAFAAWVALSAIALGRTVGTLRPRRAALWTSLTFVAVIALYLAARAVAGHPGRFL